MSGLETPENRVAADTGSPIPGAELRSLPLGAKASLAAEILVSYALVRRGLRRSDLPRLVDALRAARRGRPGLPLSDATLEGGRLGAAVVRTLEPLPADSRCLMRSLVLLRLLARRGVKGSLVIAVRPEELLALAAHAWVEVDGNPLLTPAGPDHGHLVTL